MVSRLWKQSRALTATAGLMSVNFVVALIGLLIDPRMVAGAPDWLKPAKFGLSTAIFAASMAWLFQSIPSFAQRFRWVAPMLAVILILEVAIIDFQAVRGVASHFNIATVEDSVLYAVMGTAIGVLWLMTIWITVVLFRQHFDDPAWGWALRLGLLISVLGSASGGLMTMPSAAQTAEMKQREHVKVVGAHTVGAPDGGPGVAGVGWSRDHGDLRVAHFFGLHGLQVIPLLAWWRGRKRTTRFVIATAGSYFALYLILTWQALRGESIAQPGMLTLGLLGGWLLATILAVLPNHERNTGCAMEVVHER